MSERFSMFKISQELVGSAYRLGGTSKAAGLDCFSLVYRYLADFRKADLPEEYEGLTFETYKDLWEEDPEKAKEIMLDFIREHMEEIPTTRAIAGDVLLLSIVGRSGDAFPAIHGGNGHIIAASRERGVCVTAINHYKIERAFRCRKCSH